MPCWVRRDIACEAGQREGAEFVRRTPIEPVSRPFATARGFLHVWIIASKGEHVWQGLPHPKRQRLPSPPQLVTAPANHTLQPARSALPRERVRSMTPS